MPEAPDLVIIRDFLQERLTGQMITQAAVRKATVLRSLIPGAFSDDIIGHRFATFGRRGKFLLVTLTGERSMVINPMLIGALHYCVPKERMAARVCLALDLDSGMQLRYLDETQMGKVYYGTEEEVSGVPRLEEQGPDVVDEPMTLPAFVEALKRIQGEIKGILTRGALVSGIGNAYADEILWAAQVSPFKRRKELSADDLRRLHDATYRVPEEAIAVLRERVGDNIHHKVRDFLKVHGKTDEPCPRCGAPVRAITANQRLTNFCRHCQPGMLIKN